MKKNILYIAFILLSIFQFNSAIAQNPGHEKIKQAMKNLYTERMDLTNDQAKTFWPLHDEYENERRKINKDIKNLKSNANPANLSKIDQLETQRFELRNRYKQRFLQVISSSQLSKMYSAEEEFRKMLFDRANRD